MAERLSLRLVPSRRLARMLGGAYLLTAAALWLAPVPVGWALACSLAVFVHLAFAVRRHAWLSAPGSLIQLDLLVDDCSVWGRSHAGNWKRYRVAGSSFVSPPLTVPNLRSGVGHRTRAVLVAPDSLDPDSFRRLRVWLRWRWRGESSVLGVEPSKAWQR
jgi:toxin CptA